MRSIWAVAQNTLAQALRMKVAVIVILLIFILLPIMGKVMDGDGTLLGKLQTFTSYSLGLISFLLCILTIAISAYTLSSDLKRKHIYLVLTKPIRRFELIIGKLLGIVLLNSILLAIFGIIVYALTMLIWNYSDVSAEERMRAEAEFFTSRIGVKSTLDKDALGKRAVERYKELSEKGQIPENMSYTEAMRELYGQEVMMAQKVDLGQTKEWYFENVKVKDNDDPNAMVFVQYKFQALALPPDGKIYGRWRIGDLRQFAQGAKMETPIYSFERADAVQVTCEFPVPANAVAKDGFLGLAILNDPSLNQTTVIPEEIEILYKTGTFSANYAKAILMVFVRLIFLSVLGVSLSTWLSFPVTILVCFAIFFAGLTNGFIVDAINGFETTIGTVYSLTIKPLLWLLPQFDGDYNPGRYIVEGRTLQWTFLAITAVVTLMVKALFVLLFGILIFRKREVAKAVV